MNNILFTKMHGLGNDFVIMDLDIFPPEIDIDKFVLKIADRKLGIGCDQFILYKKLDNEYFNMEIYNRDGSEAKACGNASRCLSKLIYEKFGLKEITLSVGSRKVRCYYYSDNNIKVNMGQVSFREKWMPGTEQLWSMAQQYLIEPKEVICIDVANPHLVIFTKISDKDKKIIGGNLQKNSLFPQGVNVNFATVEDKKIYLKVWERGAGFTYACGSGAVATFAAANKLGFAENEAEIVFEPGSLHMRLENDRITMNGPAEYVYRGEYFYDR